MSTYPNINASPIPHLRRVYHVTAIRHGGHFEFFPSKVFYSSLRIREFSFVMFRKWFGGRAADRPNRCWHADGFMAEACDRRGNRIQVEQVNYKVAPKLRVRPYRDSSALMVVGERRVA